MLIDRKHKPWAIAAAVIAVSAVAVYTIDAERHLTGPAGSTALGITYGAIALGMMLICAALGLKRRVPHWRIGRAQTWLRAHIWLGLLSGLFVALHGAFHLGGTMTTWLCILTTLVILSGLIGLALQYFIPSQLLHSVPGETVAQQLDRELAGLAEMAEGVVEIVRDKPKVMREGIVLRYAGKSIDEPVADYGGDAAGLDSQAVAALMKASEPIPGAEPLRAFYHAHARAFLTAGRGLLADATTSGILFGNLRIASPQHVHEGIDELELLCDRRRQLMRQRKLMRLLMGWLFIHVPLGWTLIVMAVAHAVTALRYMS